MKLFASYSNDDISHVNSFANAFKKENPKGSIFIASSKHPDDDSLEIAKKWREQLKKEIHESQGVVLFLSKSFFKSEEVIDFEWPIIQERKKRDPNFPIFTILIDDVDLKDKPNFKIIEGDEYCNTKETRLKILRGSAYNLELQNISKRIASTFYKNIEINFPSSTLVRTFLFALLLVAGVSYFYNSRISNNNLEENIVMSEITSTSTSTTEVAKTNNFYTDFSLLGLGDCLKIDISLNGPMNWKPEYFDVEEIVSCESLHNVEIISKFKVKRINSSEVVVPGSRIGFLRKEGEECFSKDDVYCNGILINEITKNGPLEKTSIKVGDVLVGINGYRVEYLNDAATILNYIEPNTKNTFTYWRIKEDGGTIEIDDSFISQSRIISDSRTAINNELLNYCISEVNLFQSLDTQFNNLPKVLLSAPIYNKNDLLRDSFTVLCVLYSAEGIYDEENNLKDIKVNDSNVSFMKLFEEEYGFYSVKAMFTSNSNTYKEIPKSFIDLEIGDCFNWNEYNVIAKAENSEFITFADCSIQYQNAQVLESLIVSENELLDNNLLIGSDEFYDYLQDKCVDVYFENLSKKEVAIALASRWLDDNGNVVKSNLNKVLWDKDENNINAKCILSYTKGTGFEKFKNAFTSIPSENNIINLDFAYCPKYTFTGAGYNFKNNFISTDEMSLEWVIPAWNIGKYPLEKIVLFTNNENISFVGTEGLTGYTFDPINKDRDWFNDRLEGTLPFMFEVIGDFSGDVTFVVMGEDAGGGNAWAECTTKVVRNASLNEIIEITETGSISKNSWDSELSFEINSNENLNNLSLPLVKSLEHKKDQEGYNLEISLSQRVNKKEIRDIYVKYVLCVEDRSINCIDNHDSEKNYLYYSSKEFGIPTIEGDFLQNFSIPLIFESCTENSKKIDFNCLDIGKNYFALLEYIFINLDSPYDCNIAYKGFTKNEDYLRETNPEGSHIKFYRDILYGENQSNTPDSEYNQDFCNDLSNTEMPYTENALLFNYHYFPSFDFSTIFNGKLYNGSPYFNLDD